ncbi:MAG: glycosyltransferase family 2 protein [Bacteroidota bacterium]|nr:glycosyltransferase family 2 protein [Bacteroidota bacterium]
MNDKLYIVMPAYNEEANIEEIVRQWHPVVEKVSSDSRLVIFNDGSKDSTWKKMMQLKDQYAQFIPVTKPNSGHGATCIFAYNYAINENAEYIFQTDSDGQTNPEEFWQFWDKRDEYNFIIGARKKRKDGFGRIVVSKVLKLMILLIFGERVNDCNTPFRLMNAQKLRPILDIIPERFFLSNVAISMLVVKRKESYLWLPISFKPRQGGTNSINFKRIIKIGYKAIADFYTVKRNIRQSGLNKHRNERKKITFAYHFRDLYHYPTGYHKKS